MLQKLLLRKIYRVQRPHYLSKNRLFTNSNYKEKISELEKEELAYQVEIEKSLSKGANNFSDQLSESMSLVNKRMGVITKKFDLNISEQKEMVEKSFNEELEKQKDSIEKKIEGKYAEVNSRLEDVTEEAKEKTETLTKKLSDDINQLQDQCRSTLESTQKDSKEIAFKLVDLHIQVESAIDALRKDVNFDLRNLEEKYYSFSKKTEEILNQLKNKLIVIKEEAEENRKILERDYKKLEWKWWKRIIYFIIASILLYLIKENSEKKAIKLMLDYFGIHIKDSHREKIKDITSYLDEEIQRLQIKYNSSYFGYKFFTYFGSHGYSHNLRMKALLSLKEEILKLNSNDLSEVGKHISTDTKKLLHEAYNFEKTPEKEDKSFLNTFLNQKLQLSINRKVDLIKLDEPVNDPRKTTDLTVHASPISQNTTNNEVPFEEKKITKNSHNEEHVNARLVSNI